MQRFGYRYASALLRQVLKQGALNPKKVHSICDFGAGLGGPSLALQNRFSKYLKRFVLLEENTLQARFAQKILPAVEISQRDGLSCLRQTEQRFDLITAFMLGPDYYDDGLVQDFIAVASQRLTEQGAILIASDVATMKVVQSQIKTQYAGGSYGQSTWILPKDDLGLKRVSFFQKCLNPALPYAVIFKPQTQSSSELEFFPALPEPHFQMVGDNLYCLTTPFEWDYFWATIQTYQIFSTPTLKQTTLKEV